MAIARKTAVLNTSALRQPMALLLAFTMLTAPHKAAWAQSLFNDQTRPGDTSQQNNTLTQQQSTTRLRTGTSTGTGTSTTSSSTPGRISTLGMATANDQTTATTDEALATASVPGRLTTTETEADSGPVAGENESIAPEGPADETADPASFNNDTPGIRIGTFTLRPSVTESINNETRRTPSGKTDRTFSTTGIRGTLSSDWARHALTVTGSGTFENTGSDRGDGPTAAIDADLRLDLPDETTANITAGYSFEREDETDPNAITGATTQSGVQNLKAGIALQRDLGVLRGTAAVGVSRTTYSGARLSDGTTLDEEGRNRTATDIRLRAGYELSEAIIPFVEVAAGITRHDTKFDASGYNRSSNFQALRAGVELDLGEKMRGEFALGHRWVNFEDDRLLVPGGFTADGTLQWSPQRGTDVNLGLRTTLEESTTAGLGGWTQYELLGGVNHRLRENLLARLSGSGKWRDYPSASGFENFVTYTTGAGLTWNINRYLDLETDVTWERTPQDGTSELRVGAGLTLKR